MWLKVLNSILWWTYLSGHHMTLRKPVWRTQFPWNGSIMQIDPLSKLIHNGSKSIFYNYPNPPQHSNLRNITRKYQLMQAAACRYSNPDMIQIRVQTVVKSTKYKKYQIRPFRYLFVNRDYRFYRLSRFGSRLEFILVFGSSLPNL